MDVLLGGEFGLCCLLLEGCKDQEGFHTKRPTNPMIFKAGLNHLLASVFWVI